MDLATRRQVSPRHMFDHRRSIDASNIEATSIQSGAALVPGGEGLLHNLSTNHITSLLCINPALNLKTYQLGMEKVKAEYFNKTRTDIDFFSPVPKHYSPRTIKIADKYL